MDSYNSIDAGSVLANRGLNGYWGSGNFVGDGSAVNANAINNGENIRAAQIVDTLNSGNSERNIVSQITTGNGFLNATIDRQTSEFRFAQLERQNFSAQLEQQRANAALAASIAEVKCCCDANSAKIDNLSALNAKDLQIQTLQLQLANCQNSGRGNQGGGNS
jgi:hypothetical protein